MFTRGIVFHEYKVRCEHLIYWCTVAHLFDRKYVQHMHSSSRVRLMKLLQASSPLQSQEKYILQQTSSGLDIHSNAGHVFNVLILCTKHHPSRFAAKGRLNPALSREATGGSGGRSPPAKFFDLTLLVLRKPEFFTLQNCI